MLSVAKHLGISSHPCKTNVGILRPAQNDRRSKRELQSKLDQARRQRLLNLAERR